MITIVRLDERLIHGQIGVAWASRMGTDTVVVVNDKAASNPLSKQTLLAAAPRNNKTVVKTVDQAIQILNDPRCETKKIFVIVGNWDDLYTIATRVPDVTYLNIGNYGRMAPSNPGLTRQAYSADIFLDEIEIEKVKKIMALPLRCECQTIPENPAVPLADLLTRGIQKKG
ncbi:PTS system mannose/fructose/N-acetylgalactosamine-transporter subunit IIB [Holdemania massiliensis]|uniref:PTS system mannose/fructose/N-acetylgalactosamine-transporter subunit IIB n=1 Tax=Holdemania massiliensis TaxID=1468449 RepID=UPI001F067C08|nr:PTS sugar transporter subunit IIB [Holdemania massiliensis]MCH1942314.1 PTS sugar transporter subunit IIB [Holdemania massiliensis]